jgi:Na+/proline symporter
MMLTVGAIATLLELADLWNTALDSEWYVPAAASVVWLAWAVVFYAYWRKGTRLEQLRRMAQSLVAGSILELLVATGVYAWKPDHDDCWCARGSYAGLVFSATVMIWAFGPGLLFLFLREKRHRRGVEHPPPAA